MGPTRASEMSGRVLEGAALADGRRGIRRKDGTRAKEDQAGLGERGGKGQTRSVRRLHCYTHTRQCCTEKKGEREEREGER